MVSGEKNYGLVLASGQKDKVCLAGADAIITYHAKDAAGWLRKGGELYV